MPHCGEDNRAVGPSRACIEDLPPLPGLSSALQDRLTVSVPGNNQAEEKQVTAALAASPVITWPRDD